MKITVLTGAGISAESGIPTFRDAGGLWENHKVEEVATPQGWLTNPELVWKFYQERRRNIKEAKPNKAHFDLAELEQKLLSNKNEFTLITQNIDGLHLKAGSVNVIEMHGSLRKLRCQKCNLILENSDYLDDSFLPCFSCGYEMMRPDVVWFEEFPKEHEKFLEAVQTCDVFVSIGTSGEVYPASGFIKEVLRPNRDCRVYYQNIEPMPSFYKSLGVKEFCGKATEQVELIGNDIFNWIIWNDQNYLP